MVLGGWGWIEVQGGVGGEGMTRINCIQLFSIKRMLYKKNPTWSLWSALFSYHIAL